MNHQTSRTSCKFFTKLAVIIFFCCTLINPLQAAPRRYPDDQTTIALREMRATIDDLRHEVGNHETEIKTYEEKLHNLENIIDSLRQHSTDTSQAHKEALQDSSASLEMKINSLETTTKGLVADIKQFKTHANETTSTLSHYKQKLLELEKILDIQNQNLDSLQTALRSLTDILQAKANPGFSSNSPSLSTGKTYKVIPGDSLEKIARKNQTNIQTIKELNGLSNDKIIVGQTLKVP